MPINVRDIRRIIDEVYPAMVALRRDLHQHPEAAYEEVRTAAKVAQQLKKLGIPHRTKVGRTGVVALIRGKRPGGCVALRADMDALPMDEKNDLPYASVVPGRMHACGHDGHTANLVGVAHVLSRLRDEISGSVKLIFQPAEEGGAGAAAMIRNGALKNPKPDVIYALHQTPLVPLGRIGWHYGAMCASTTSLDVTFRGRGAHAARPHEGVDPVVMVATFIQAVQTVASRRVDPLDPVVVTFGSMHSGTVRNVIPDVATLSGTLRTYDRKTLAVAVREIRRLAEGIARSCGGSADVRIRESYPPVINAGKAVDFLKETAVEAVGKENTVEVPASMGGEDFAYFLEGIPGAFFRLGNGRPKRPSHGPTFDFDDRAMKRGILVMSLLAVRWLEKH